MGFSTSTSKPAFEQAAAERACSLVGTARLTASIFSVSASRDRGDAGGEFRGDLRRARGVGVHDADQFDALHFAPTRVRGCGRTRRRRQRLREWAFRSRFLLDAAPCASPLSARDNGFRRKRLDGDACIVRRAISASRSNSSVRPRIDGQRSGVRARITSMVVTPMTGTSKRMSCLAC